MISVDLFQIFVSFSFILCLMVIFFLWYYTCILLPFILLPKLDRQIEMLVAEIERLQSMHSDNDTIDVACDTMKMYLQPFYNENKKNADWKEMAIWQLEHGGVTSIMSDMQFTHLYRLQINSREMSDFNRLFINFLNFTVRVVKYNSPLVYAFVWISLLLKKQCESHSQEIMLQQFLMNRLQELSASVFPNNMVALGRTVHT